MSRLKFWKVPGAYLLGLVFLMHCRTMYKNFQTVVHALHWWCMMKCTPLLFLTDFLASSSATWKVLQCIIWVLFTNENKSGVGYARHNIAPDDHIAFISVCIWPRPCSIAPPNWLNRLEFQSCIQVDCSSSVLQWISKPRLAKNHETWDLHFYQSSYKCNILRPSRPRAVSNLCLIWNLAWLAIAVAEIIWLVYCWCIAVA